METALPGLLLVAGKYLFQEYTAEQVMRLIVRITKTAGMAALGAITTCGDVRALCCSLFVFYFWGVSGSRAEAGNRAFLYFLGATWVLPESIVTFYDTVALRIPLALLLWSTACFLLSVPFGALWSEVPWRRSVAALFIVALLSLPPLGLLCVVSPFLAAGVVFPGMGEWGVCGVVVLASLLSGGKRAWILMPPLVAAALFASRIARADLGSTSIVPINTRFPLETGDVRPRSEWERARAVERFGEEARGKIALLPESLAGHVTESSSRLWSDVRRRIQATALILGGDRELPKHRENALYLIDGATPTATVAYRQRIPVPISMWKPWSPRQSYPLSLKESGVFEFRGKTLGALICYESLLAFPILQTMYHRPDQVLVVGNLWWAKRTHLAEIIKAYSKSWEYLFGVPFIVSLNR